MGTMFCGGGWVYLFLFQLFEYIVFVSTLFDFDLIQFDSIEEATTTTTINPAIPEDERNQSSKITSTGALSEAAVLSNCNLF